MRAITIRPPWPTAIFELGKTVENRTNSASWGCVIGERIAIHTGRTWEQTAVDEIQRITGQLITGAPVSVIVGTVRVASIHLADECWDGEQHCSPWAHPNEPNKPVGHLVLTDPIALPLDQHLQYPGALGPWRVPTVFAKQLEVAA